MKSVMKNGKMMENEYKINIIKAYSGKKAWEKTVDEESHHNGLELIWIQRI